MKYQSFISLTFFLLFFVECVAQQSDYVFHQFSTEDNAVECVLQDKRGFVWAGTYNGLFRYDGEAVSVFRPQKSDSLSISSSFVEALAEDSKGNIWIGTREGILNCYYIEQQVFHKYVIPKGDDFLLNSIRSIYVENDSTIWCGLESGLVQFNPITQKWKNHLPSSQTDYWNAYYDIFYKVAADPSDPNILWAGGRSELFRFDKTTERFDTLKPSKGYFPYGGLTHIAFEEEIIWFASNASTIIEYHPAEDSTAAYKHPFDNNLLYRGMVKMGDLIWVAAYTGGLGVFDTKTKQYHFFEHDPAVSTSIAKGGARSLAKGNNGELWIGLDEGLAMVNTQKTNFQHHHFSSDFSHAADAFYVRDYAIVNDSTWVVATSVGDGLYFYNPIKKQTIKKITRYPEEEKRDWHFDVLSILKDRNDRIWIGTFHGLYEFDRDKEVLVAFANKEKNNIGDILFSNLQLSTNGDWWAYTYRPRGVFNMSADAKSTRHYTFDKNNPYLLPSADNLNDVHVAPNNNIWIVSAPNILCKKANKEQFENVLSREDLGSNWPTQVLEDQEGDIWIGYKGIGLERFRNGQKIDNYRVEDGLPADVIYELILDQEGNIWIATSNGLSVFVKEEQVFKNFGKGDGLIRADLGYYWASQLRLKPDGQMVIAGHGFMSTFDPKELLQSQANPSLVFKEFFVFDKEQKLGKQLQNKDHINLTYEDQVFSFSVTSFPYSYADKIDYEYRLKGMDEAWRISKNGQIEFANIPSGSYTFEVKVRNEPLSLQQITLYIRPPFWKTYWFIISMALLFGVLIFGAIYWRFKLLQARDRERLLFEKQLVETEMTALRAQMNPHFLFNSLNSIKKYILKNEPRVASRYLTKFSRLMRFILDNSKEDEIPLERELETLQLYIELEAMRFQNKFEFAIHVDQSVSLAHVFVPPLLLQPFVENAIWHGLMHKPTEGQLSISISRVENILYLEVEDDGIGRTAAAQIKRSSLQQHRSHGVSITEKRLQIFRKEGDEPSKLRYEDLINKNQEPVGTKIIIQIPIHENH